MDQAKYIYKKVEQESIDNIETTKQKLEDDRLDKDYIDNEEEVNPYKNIIINEFDEEDIIATQMEQWLILSNIVNYVQYNRNPRDFYNLDVKVIDQKYRKLYDILKKKIDRL